MAIETTAKKHELLITVVLVACVLIVVFWEVMAGISSGMSRPFSITALNFTGFAPDSASWSLRSLPVRHDSLEPNIVIYEITRKEKELRSAPVLVRLVHGYNMPDCMRIKGYKVELMEDSRLSQKTAARPGMGALVHKIQIWRLTSATGELSIWITGMLKAGDFSETDVDVRTMAFPRVGIPDNPDWLPRGVTGTSLRHPIRNFRLLLKGNWNSARCDLPTFLRLKRPEWANEELLTLVVVTPQFAAKSKSDADMYSPATSRSIEAYGFMLNELQKWRLKLNNAEPIHDRPSGAKSAK